MARENGDAADTALSGDGQPGAAGPHDLPRTIIRPAGGWQGINFRELWQYRELLYFLAWRDVKVRYKQTVLGAAWAILQPAMMMVVFSIFFGRMAHVNTAGLPYPLFVFCGLLPWSFFATAVANAGNSVVGSERLITKVYFPRLAIPFASVGAALVDFAVAFGMLLVLMAWYRVLPTWNLLLVPPLVVLFAIAALGVGTLLAALNVAYRDFRYVIPFLIQLWMFATPTIYMEIADVRGPSSVVNGREDAGSGRMADTSPKSMSAYLAINPLVGLVSAFRAAAIGGPVPWHLLGWSTAGVAAVLVIGCLYFLRVEDSFADII